MSYPCTLRIFPKKTFPDLQDHEALEVFCSSVKSIELNLNNVLRRIAGFWLILLIIISIFGKIKEKYKIIVLHSATLNLSLLIINEIQYSFLPGLKAIEIIPAYPYITHIAAASFLPLAINRSLRLYSNNYLNTYLKICIFLGVYDSLIAAYFWITLIFNYNTFMEMAFDVFVVVPTLGIAAMIFVKIRTLKNQTTGSFHQKSTLRDLEKAAIVCLVQPICSFVYLSMVIIGQYFNAQVNAEKYPTILTYKIYLAISRFYPCVNMICIIIDCLLFIFVLRAYRTSLALMIVKLLTAKNQIYASNVVFISKITS